jgi:hypothetical protein
LARRRARSTRRGRARAWPPTPQSCRSRSHLTPARRAHHRQSRERRAHSLE